MGDAWYAKAFGAHYPLLYAHRDLSEARDCLDLMATLAPLAAVDGAPVLDLGCGDGRHLSLLASRDIDAVGLDLSRDLLGGAVARLGATSPPPLVCGDMRRLPFFSDSFAGVLSMFTAFGYFGDLAANTLPVREIGRVLLPGGHWFLDYLDCDSVRKELGGGQLRERNRTAGPLAIVEQRRLDAESKEVAKYVRITPRPGRKAEAARVGVPEAGLSYTERVALFTQRELDDMAAEGGLERVASAGGYGGEPLGAGSRWILVYRERSERRSRS